MSTTPNTQFDAYEAATELHAEVRDLVRQWGTEEERRLVLKRLGAIADADPRRALALVGRLIKVFDYYDGSDLTEMLIAAYVDRDSTDEEVVGARSPFTGKASPAAEALISTGAPPPAPSGLTIERELEEGRF